MCSVPVHPARPQSSPHPPRAPPPGVPPADPTCSPPHADPSSQDTDWTEKRSSFICPAGRGAAGAAPAQQGRTGMPCPLPRGHPPGGQRDVPVRARRCPGPRACGPAATAGTRGRRAARYRGTARRVWPRCSAGRSKAAGRGCCDRVSEPHLHRTHRPVPQFPPPRSTDSPSGLAKDPPALPTRYNARLSPGGSRTRDATAARPAVEPPGERSDPTRVNSEPGAAVPGTRRRAAGCIPGSRGRGPEPPGGA